MPKDKAKTKDSVPLTKAQYLALLKAVYLGNWMANAHRCGAPEDPMMEEYESITHYVFSLASKFGLGRYVSHEAGDGPRFYPTGDFEERADVQGLREEYDENTFWDEFSDRMGERDFHRKYSPEEIVKMSDEERFLKLQDCIIV